MQLLEPDSEDPGDTPRRGGGPPFEGTFDRGGCYPDARVIVGGIEVPYVNEGVTVTERKDGQADITRRSEVVVPVVWGDSVIADKINSLSGRKNPQQDVRIELRDFDKDPEEVGADAYQTVHRGFVRSAGGHSTYGAGNIVVGDYAELFNEIGFSGSFEVARIKSVLDTARKAFLDGQTLLDGLAIEVRGEDEWAIVGQDVSVYDEGLAIESDIVEEVFEGRQFTRDRNSLADVLDWLCERLNARWYIGADDGDSPALVVDTSPGRAFHDENHVDGGENSEGVIPISNNALFQLNPAHSLRVKGYSKRSVVAQLDPTVPTDVFPAATAEYTPLAENAQGVTTPITRERDATTLAEAEALAKQLLKDRLDAATGGEMRLGLSPRIRPYSTIEAVPVCGEVARASMPAIRYEVTEAIHSSPTVGASSDINTPQTTVRCSLAVDPDKISVSSSMEKL